MGKLFAIIILRSHADFMADDLNSVELLTAPPVPLSSESADNAITDGRTGSAMRKMAAGSPIGV